MRTTIATYFRSKYTLASNRISAFYHAALRLGGLEDNETNRIMAGIVASVLIWYACVLIDAVCHMIHETTVITALVTQ